MNNSMSTLNKLGGKFQFSVYNPGSLQCPMCRIALYFIGAHILPMVDSAAN